MSIPIMPGTYHPPGQRRRSLKSRIKRRARELSLLAYQRYLEAITRELDARRLDPELLEFWEPTRVDRAHLRNRLLKVHQELVVAIGSVDAAVVTETEAT